jgi:hypothetical protein
MKFRHFFILSLSILIGYRLTYYFEDYSILKPMLLFIGNGLFIIAFSINLILDYQDFKSLKSKFAFSSTLLGIILYMVLVSFYEYKKQPLKKFNKMAFTYKSAINGTTINLKKDGTFVVDDFSNMGGVYYYGDYIQKDSLLYLKNFNKVGFPISEFYFNKQDSVIYEIKNKTINYTKKYK